MGKTFNSKSPEVRSAAIVEGLCKLRERLEDGNSWTHSWYMVFGSVANSISREVRTRADYLELLNWYADNRGMNVSYVRKEDGKVATVKVRSARRGDDKKEAAKNLSENLALPRGITA